MKVALVTPNFHQPRGNTVTVQRIADKLENRGVETEIISITDDNMITELPNADIIHGFHAYHFFTFKKKLEQKIDSYVLTITGTDLNHDLFNNARRADVIQSVTEAKAVHVFNEKAKQILIEEIPAVSDRIYVIPQGISDLNDTKLTIDKEANTFLFVLPAGIRKVKNIPFAINMLERLHEKAGHIRLLIVGPIIEEDEGQLVKDLVEKNKDWVQYIGQVPHSLMGAVYKHGDAMLNTSHSEGQSTSIIEAMGYGLPVLVSSNEGNLSLVTHEQTGLVFNGESEFLDYAERLVNNNELRETLGGAAQEYIAKHHSDTSEVEILLNIYECIRKQNREQVSQ
ncbi:glycosyltransferase family 4 protein [Peribacillus sp. SCS-155]|uniref:glycosyltransferase family 4 protein n=1 Tax=Peribacillus sedimenti TaxID=3115297 RepID=UPI0039069BE1